jgi:probable F420-dependent oxidoreductase
MKIGVNLLNFGPGASPEALRSWAEFAETRGFHFVMISDHVALTPDVQTRYPAPFYDPFISLSWLAGITTNIEIGTSVIVLPYRSPLLMARMAAAIDQMSNGRFIFGVGVGWARREFEALGVPFHQRGAITDEYLAAIKELWTNDSASFEGDHVSFQDVHTGPKPKRAPHPPIWVGGSSDAGLRRAVRFGDAWHPINIRVDWLKNDGLPRLKAIADSEERPMPALCPRIRFHITETPANEDTRIAGEGTLDQIRRDLEGLQSLGADYVLLDTYLGDPEATKDQETPWRMLSTLAEEVLDLGRESLR